MVWGFALWASTPQDDPTGRVWGFALRATTPQAGYKVLGTGLRLPALNNRLKMH